MVSATITVGPRELLGRPGGCRERCRGRSVPAVRRGDRAVGLVKGLFEHDDQLLGHRSAITSRRRFQPAVEVGRQVLDCESGHELLQQNAGRILAKPQSPCNDDPLFDVDPESRYAAPLISAVCELKLRTVLQLTAHCGLGYDSGTSRRAEVAELADARDSKSRGPCDLGGSIPPFGTTANPRPKRVCWLSPLPRTTSKYPQKTPTVSKTVPALS